MDAEDINNKVEQLITRYFYADRRQDSAKWEKAEILAELVKYRSVNWIAQRTETCASYVREMVRTVNVFPKKEDRGNVSFTHHRMVATNHDIDDPKKWIDIAAREKLTTRGLSLRIKGPRAPGASPALTIEALKEENERLRAENERLRKIIKAVRQKLGWTA